MDFLSNKNAQIWAFNECIDKNTSFEGNTKVESIRQTKQIIEYLISIKCFTQHITEEILNDFYCILDVIFVNNIKISEIDKHDKYISAGWKDHSILLFYTKNLHNDKYSFGLINCGLGIELQGHNSSYCNGLIIINDIELENIQNFFETYNIYYEKTLNDYNFKNYKLHKNFYFILLDKILNIKYSVNLEEIAKTHNINLYKLDVQLIGSCSFTNLINLIFYLYIKPLPSSNTSEYYENYLEWYNISKKYIKEKLFNDIISGCDVKYVNFYNYILDTNSDLRRSASYEEILKKNNILNKDLKYEPIKESIKNNSINRENINKLIVNKRTQQILWDIYDDNNNLDCNLEYLHTLLNDSNNYYKLIDDLISFFSNCKLFDNDSSLMLVLFIIYKINKFKEITHKLEYLYNKFHSKEQLFKSVSNTHTTNISINDKKGSSLLYYMIYLIIIKNKIPKQEKYYNNEHSSYDEKSKINIKRYNYHFFSFIPIINSYYENIVSDIIADLNKNIEIFPDLTNEKLFTYNRGIDYSIFFSGCQIVNRLEHEQYYFYKNMITEIRYFKNEKVSEMFFLNYYSTFASLEIERNLLLWHIFIDDDDNINNNISLKFLYEIYGYYKEGFFNEEMFIIRDNIKSRDSISTENNIIEYPGRFKLYKQKINLFFVKLIIELNETNSFSFKILKKYLIYFYLCELSNLKIKDEIFKKFDNHLYKYFDEIWFIPHFHSLIYTYVLKYNKNYMIPSNRVIIKKDDNCLISKNEENNFVLSTYDCYIKADYYSSVIDFFIIQYNDTIRLFIPKNDKNTSESIEIIKNILLKYNNVYYALNFYYKKNEDHIIGINKNNEDYILIIDLDYNITHYIENCINFDILKYEELPEKYKNFYNLMTHNDFGLFIYKLDDIYYLKMFNFDLIFQMHSDKIYYKEYEVSYCCDYNFYFNYGILKLSNEKENKLLCLYNYKNILNNNDNEEIKFLDPLFFNYKEKYENINEIDINFRTYFYKIINKYDDKDKYIISNKQEVQALLLNCINYNSPFLIFKNIEQIKVIISNNNQIDKFINIIFSKLNYIYGLPILLLFYKDKILNEYYYKYANILYKNYDILLKIKYTPTNFDYILNYNKLSLVSNKESDLDYLYFTSFNFNEYEKNIKTGEFIFFKDKKQIVNIIQIIENIRTIKQTDYLLKIKYNKQYVSIDYKFLFKKLLLHYISTDVFKENIFEVNISKATELYEYLINPDKQILYPIQELIMGSGKTTVITPYICIKFLDLFLSNLETYDFNNEIIIVMPDFLINSSFEILMKNLFILFNNFEIVIYPNNNNYVNSYKITLISDTNYKILFLNESLNTEKKYMIYDEVDMMANPLTCELNIPIQKKKLEEVNLLYKLSELLYTNIFINKEFWKKIKNKEFNTIHYYIYNLDKDCIDYVNCFFDDLVSIKSNINLIKHIKENILFFLLTNQYNFDYGMPEQYNTPQKYNYMYKAIPYSAVNNPIIGSEFSDPILTYILTFFCYKIKNGNYRNIDKDFIVEYYESLYKKDNNKFDELIIFFKEKPEKYSFYVKNKDYYKTKYNEIFELDEINFNIIINKILNLNIEYFLNCKNISFNDLLFYKNVKNFICYTGTAYIKVPISNELVNFDSHNYINYSGIDDFSKVSDAIDFIIERRIDSIFINKNENKLIEDIFNCLKNYDVLIDIGGIFIKYEISLFIEEYKKINTSKEYLVYFDYGRKIINLKNSKFVDDYSINNNNAFYYFSNNNITGVDAKNIMYINAKGLVTITNKTNFRDFSQGVFRMRNILDSQKIDIIFNSKFIDLIIQTGGNCDNFNKITRQNIKASLKKNLLKQQDLLDKQKEKILLKQNIFAIYKDDTYKNNELILFCDPSSRKYLQLLQIFNEFKKEKSLLNIDYDNDTLNISRIYNKIDENKYCLFMYLIFKYFNYELINLKEIKKNIVYDHEEEKEEEEEEEKEEEKTKKQKILFFAESIIIDEPKTILYNLKTINLENKEITSKNQILLTSCNLNFIENFLENSLRFDTILIYDNQNNNLCIFTLRDLSIFLMYNDNISENYTIISIYNSSIYGKIINKGLINYLLQITVSIINKITEPFKPNIKDSKINKYLVKFKTEIASKELDLSIKFDKPPPLKLSYSNMPKDTRHSSSSNSSFGFNFFSEFKSPLSNSKDLFNSKDFFKSQIWHQNPIDLPLEEHKFLFPPQPSKEPIELLPERPKKLSELLPKKPKFFFPPPPPQPPPKKFKQPNYRFKYLKYKLKYLKLKEILN